MRKNNLAIIVPCYNEESILNYSIEQLLVVLDIMIDGELISQNSKVYFINDGSTDKTRDLIEKRCKNNNKIALINLSKNYGQQSAMIAGLNTIKADMYVTIDADLQDDPVLIIDMVKKYFEGYEIVYGCREKRDTDSFFKKNSAILFYKFMCLIGVNIRQNHSEFRLLSSIAVERLKEFKEKTIFLRGIIQNMGLKSCNLYYDRLKRLGGKTKYSILSLLELAWTAVTSFSLLPLRIITATGIITILASFLMIIYMIIVNNLQNHLVPISRLTIWTITFFSGIIIMSLGIIGEYLGKILIEVKNRPLYQIDEMINV